MPLAAIFCMAIVTVPFEAPARRNRWSRRIANHPACDEPDWAGNYSASKRAQGAIAEPLICGGGQRE